MNERRELILNLVEDVLSDFLYYDRKEDEDLPLGEIEDAIICGEITAEDIASRFRLHLVNFESNIKMYHLCKIAGEC